MDLLVYDLLKTGGCLTLHALHQPYIPYIQPYIQFISYLSINTIILLINI